MNTVSIQVKGFSWRVAGCPKGYLVDFTTYLYNTKSCYYSCFLSVIPVILLSIVPESMHLEWRTVSFEQKVWLTAQMQNISSHRKLYPPPLEPWSCLWPFSLFSRPNTSLLSTYHVSSPPCNRYSSQFLCCLYIHFLRFHSPPLAYINPPPSLANAATDRNIQPIGTSRFESITGFMSQDESRCDISRFQFLASFSSCTVTSFSLFGKALGE